MDPIEIKRLAAEGIKARIAQLQLMLEELEGSGGSRRGRPAGKTKSPAAVRKRPRMSPEARKKMSDLMKARWAARKAKRK